MTAKIRPDAPVQQVAVATLQKRLEVVRESLKLAARHADEDPEFVHDLRVSTRRAMAALRLYAPLLRKQPRGWFLKTLKRIRRSAGAARDLDVLLMTYGKAVKSNEQTFRDQLQKRRRKAQAPIRRLHRELRGKDWNRRCQALRRGCKRKGVGQMEFAEFASDQLDRHSRRFLRDTTSCTQDLKSLHAVRIRVKELRYVMELLAPAFPKSARRRLYRSIGEIQEQLGTINDHAVAIRSFRRWAKDANRAGRKHLSALRRKEKDELDRSLRKFQRRWNSESFALMQRRFTALQVGADCGGSSDR